MSKHLWNPQPAESENSQLAFFMREVLGERKLSPEAFTDWTLENSAEFWGAWLKSSQIIFSGHPARVYEAPADGGMRGGQWFPDLSLNFAENLLAQLHAVPLVGLNENGQTREFPRTEVLQTVASLQQYLKSLGVGPGDRVAGFLPNLPETILAMLATTSLGAVWSSCSPDFGVQGVLDRFTQIEPKVLFVTDRYLYNGKDFSLAEKNQAIAAKLPSLMAQVNVANWQNILAPFKNASLEFPKFPFAHPVYVLFSSGTTGAPKGIVHGAGGTLLQHTKELKLHCDLHARDKLLYFTTCGWMMWNWMLSGLQAGAQIYTFDGSPFVGPEKNIWQLLEAENISVFGTSAKFISTCRALHYSPRATLKLKNLRLVLSTGSPLSPEDFDYFYDQVVHAPVPLSSISGGTDIVSCFMLGHPMKPVIRGEIQSRGLGMDVRALSDAGLPVRDERGELVCARPFPSMPVAFWRDPSGEKYEQAYFKRFAGLWHHGDYITLTREGGIVVHGRSDATLNPGGVRIGTAEIYRQVESLDWIQDSLAVGQPVDGDEKVLLFVKLKTTQPRLEAAQEAQIKDRIKKGASPRHVPAQILVCPDIPYTVNGKKVELAVKQLLQGIEPKNTEALANPKSLEFFRALNAKKAP